jgi:hypothetical protein
MKLYAQCLQLTGDIQGHINILLKLLLRRPEIGHVDGPQYMNELEQDLVQYNTRISSINPLTVAMERPLRNYFTLQIGARASHRNNEDGFIIRVLLTNLFPRSLIVNSVKVKVTSVHTGHEIWFKATNIELQTGKNEILTTCNITAPGTYIFERAVLEWHSLTFQQEFVETGRKQYLNLYPHGNALYTSAKLAEESAYSFYVVG